MFFVSCSDTGAGDKNDQDLQEQQRIASLVSNASGNNVRIVWQAPPAEFVEYSYIVLKNEEELTIRKRLDVSASAGSGKNLEEIIALSEGSYVVEIWVVPYARAPFIWKGPTVIGVATLATMPAAVSSNRIGIRTEYTSSEEADITLTWEAPTVAGTLHKGADAEIDYYIVYLKQGTDVSEFDYDSRHVVYERDYVSIVRNAGEQQAEPKSITLKELKQGKDYAIVVQTVNTGGLWSVSDKKVISAGNFSIGNPDRSIVTLNTRASKTEAFIDLEWTTPDPGKRFDNSPAEIKKYSVYWQQGSRVSTDFFAEEAPLILVQGTTGATITGLAHDTEYSVIVRVENDVGLTSISEAQNIVTAQATSAVPPDPVQSFTANAATDVIAIELEWEGSANYGVMDNGVDSDTFQEYRIYWREADGSQSAFYVITDPNTSELTITENNLKGNTEYTVVIVVVNQSGLVSSESQNIVRTLDLSTEPEKPFFSAITEIPTLSWTSLRLEWTGLSNFGLGAEGNPATINAFRLYWKEGESVAIDDYDGMLHISSKHFSMTIDKLKFSTPYAIILEIENSGQRSAVSEIRELTTVDVPTSADPQPIENLKAVPDPDLSSKSIIVTWDIPGDFGRDYYGRAAGFQSYLIQATAMMGDHFISKPLSFSILSQVGRYVIPDAALVDNQKYHIEIVIINAVNMHSSPTSTTVYTNDFSLIPGVVSSITIDKLHRVDGQMKVYWDPVSKGEASNQDQSENVYKVYISDHMPGQTAEDLVQREDKLVSSFIPPADAKKVEYIFENLEKAAYYDVAIFAANSKKEWVKGRPYIENKLRSNGLGSISIAMSSRQSITDLEFGRHGKRAVEYSFATFENMEAGESCENLYTLHFDLLASYFNFNHSVIWESSDESVATIGEYTAYKPEAGATIVIHNAGRTDITVRYALDREVSDTITLIATKGDISSSRLRYGAILLTEGTSKEYPVLDLQDATSNCLPLSYTIEVTPYTPEITIDENSGTITVSSQAGRENYLATITAEPKNKQLYTGSVELEIPVLVLGEEILYKPNASEEDRNLFSIGDVDNSYLFQFVGGTNADRADVKADIRISAADNILYDAKDIPPAVTDDSCVGNSGIGDDIIGFGPDESNMVDFNALPAGVLTVEIWLNRGGTLFAQQTVNVEKGTVGEIRSWRDLQNMNLDLNGDYVLMNDIIFPMQGTYGYSYFEPIGFTDCSNMKYLPPPPAPPGSFPDDNIPDPDDPSDGFDDGGRSFFDIKEDGCVGPDYGCRWNPFKGTFDGRGYTISGMHVSTTIDAGLFGRTRHATIKNVVLKQSTITAMRYLGGIVGFVMDSTIENVAVEGEDVSFVNGVGCPSWQAGGLVGASFDSTIKGYAILGKVSSGGKVGGLVGSSTRSTITGYAVTTVRGVIDGVGGFVGFEEDSIITGYALSSLEYTTNFYLHTSKDYGAFIGSTSGNNVFGYHAAGVGLLDISYAHHDVGRDYFTGHAYSTPVDITTVDDSNYESVFQFFDFSPGGDWEWKGAGQWPALRMNN